MDQRTCYENCFSLRRKIKNAKEALRDVTVEHHTRIRRAIHMSYIGQQMIFDMSRIVLRKLEGYIEKLENTEFATALCERFDVDQEVREARERALWAWVSSLPETASRIRAGMQQDHIRSLLFRSEEACVPVATNSRTSAEGAPH